MLIVKGVLFWQFFALNSGFYVTNEEKKKELKVPLALERSPPSANLLKLIEGEYGTEKALDPDLTLRERRAIPFEVASGDWIVNGSVAFGSGTAICDLPVCHSNATCVSLGTLNYLCCCKEGFTGDGKSCEDADECAMGTHACSEYGVCNNTVGSYQCTCNANFVGDGETCTDINECDDESLCSNELDCVNTLGSYTCVCNGRKLGPNGERCVKGFNRHRANLRLKQDYTAALANKSSSAFKDVETGVKTAVMKIYADNPEYIEVEVNELRNGSIIADLELTFTDKDGEGLTDLVSAVRNNSFGDFNVDPDALQVLFTGSCATHKCPANSRCEQLTADTVSCPCNAGYYYDGVKCIEFIVINVTIALKDDFTEDLKNSSSPAYKELERNVNKELFEAFKDTPNFQEVVVLGFRNGSIVVDFKVVYRKDPDPVVNEKTVVAETLKEEIIKNKKLGNLDLDITQTFIQGTPPPPTNLTHTDVTETRIDIEWDKPIGHELFAIHGYRISHKKSSDTAFTTMNISSNGELNSVLNNLQKDTFYIITVRGYNDDGDGDEQKIEVTTKKSEDSVIIYVVAAIVGVVLIIALIVLVICIRKRRNKRRRKSRRRTYIDQNDSYTMTRSLSNMPSWWLQYYHEGHPDNESKSSRRLYHSQL